MTPQTSGLELRLTNKHATVIGATGLIGSELVRLLDRSAAYVQVNVLARGPRPGSLSKKVEWRSMPKLDAFRAAWPAHDTEEEMCVAVQQVLPKGDDFFSCLGTTRATAGSLSAFRFVDLGINTAFAKTAAQLNYDQYSLVSALGADPRSYLAYSKAKGELELAVSVLPFWAVHLYQPSLLIGSRDETRLGERVGAAMLGGLAKLGIAREASFQGIAAGAVARAMVAGAQRSKPGLRRYVRADMVV